MLYSPAIWQQGLQAFVNIAVKPIANGDVIIGVAQVHEPQLEWFDGIKLGHCRVGFSWTAAVLWITVLPHQRRTQVNLSFPKGCLERHLAYLIKEKYTLRGPEQQLITPSDSKWVAL